MIYLKKLVLCWISQDQRRTPRILKSNQARRCIFPRSKAFSARHSQSFAYSQVLTNDWATSINIWNEKTYEHRDACSKGTPSGFRLPRHHSSIRDRWASSSISLWKNSLRPTISKRSIPLGFARFSLGSWSVCIPTKSMNWKNAWRWLFTLHTRKFIFLIWLWHHWLL